MRSFGAHLEVLVRPDRQPAHENRLCRCGAVVSNLRASAALGPAGELSRSTVEVGILHPQKHQGNSRLRLCMQASSPPVRQVPFRQLIV